MKGWYRKRINDLEEATEKTFRLWWREVFLLWWAVWWPGITLWAVAGVVISIPATIPVLIAGHSLWVGPLVGFTLAAIIVGLPILISGDEMIVDGQWKRDCKKYKKAKTLWNKNTYKT